MSITHLSRKCDRREVNALKAQTEIYLLSRT
jgi:hypothetical protein